MFEFGKHTPFVLWSYGITLTAITLLIIYTYLRGRK